jgi:hypothetical protein
VCDFRDHPLYDWLRLSTHSGRHCDTRFFVFRPEFFRDFLDHLIDGHERGAWHMERHYYSVLKLLEDGSRVICRFRVEPRYRGTAGHWDKSYSAPKAVAKEFARASCRRLMPWLRI